MAIDKELWAQTFRNVCMGFFDARECVFVVPWNELDDFNKNKWRSCSERVAKTYDDIKEESKDKVDGD